MRWISMVPSWTELLIECGAEVVGRTRFCIHPAKQVAKISAVGGTKDLNLEKLRALDGDLLLLDREENPKAMAEESPIPFHASHVRSIEDLPREIAALATLATNGNEPDLAQRLCRVQARWERVVRASRLSLEPPTNLEFQTNSNPRTSWENFPGVLEWLTPVPPVERKIIKTELVYVIWKAPWMAASEGTFISSVLHALGVGRDKIFSPPAPNLYPVFEIADLPPGAVVFLSSEPYPFGLKKAAVLAELKAQVLKQDLALALVDGESFSWFGLRSLRFLEECHALTDVNLEASQKAKPSSQ